MRVLILTSSTGGCHDMRAHAFTEWAGDGAVVRTHRPLEDSHRIYAFGVGLYNWIQRTAPRLHHIYFNFLEAVPIIRAAKPLGAERYRAVLEDFRPDIILSVHDSLNHGFFEYARTVLGSVRCVTYCDELAGGYGFSRHWVNPAADLFLGAVPATCDAAVSCGMAPEKTRVAGFLNRRVFYEADSEPTDEFTLLLMASGQGAQNHVRFLDALWRAGVMVPVNVLCGASAAAARDVTAWAAAHPSWRVRVLPSDSNVASLMRSASAVVARPGTGTTSEAMLTRCPLLLNGQGGIMPQEMLSVKFCRRHRVGEFLRQPDDLPRVVAAWRQNPALLAEIRHRMQVACPPSDPHEFLKKITSLVQSR
ncbi:MAG: UDP-N-acetylglucosamine--LPS N-acetylglucosamine transferase [Verrucomicrobiota bacterium]